MAKQRMYEGGRVPKRRTMKESGEETIQTNILMPVAMWEAGKFLAVRERCTFRDIILRGLTRELGERARPADAELTETKT
jgi:hypothetical protein